MGYAVLVMVLMVFCPTGLLGLLDRMFKSARKTATTETPPGVVTAAATPGDGAR
jgi:hypothetical protein